LEVREIVWRLAFGVWRLAFGVRAYSRIGWRRSHSWSAAFPRPRDEAEKGWPASGVLEY
jgi:hypothetical protein